MKNKNQKYIKMLNNKNQKKIYQKLFYRVLMMKKK